MLIRVALEPVSRVNGLLRGGVWSGKKQEKASDKVSKKASWVSASGVRYTTETIGSAEMKLKDAGRATSADRQEHAGKPRIRKIVEPQKKIHVKATQQAGAYVGTLRRT